MRRTDLIGLVLARKTSSKNLMEYRRVVKNANCINNNSILGILLSNAIPLHTKKAIISNYHNTQASHEKHIQLKVADNGPDLIV